MICMEYKCNDCGYITSNENVKEIGCPECDGFNWKEIK